MSRKIALACLSVTTALVLILAGCNPFSVITQTINSDDADGYVKNPPPPKHAAGEIPGIGGKVQDSGNTAEYTFSPGKTGMWIVTLEPSGDVSNAALRVSDQNDDVLDPIHNEGKDEVFLLDSGNVYTIAIELVLYTVGTDNSFSLSVFQPVVIPGGGDERPFSDFSSLFSFTPDTSGEWTFGAYDIVGSTMASIGVRNTDFESISYVTVYIKDGDEDVKVTVSPDLDAGTEYLVFISLYNWSASCKLGVSFTG